MKINHANEIHTDMTRLIFNKKGYILSIEFWYNQKKYSYRDFTETRSLNALKPSFCSNVKDDKSYKDYNKESIKELLSFLDNEENFKNAVNYRVDNHQLSYKYNICDVMLEIITKIEKQEMIKAYIDEHKEEIKRQFLIDDLNKDLAIKEITSKKTKI